MAEFARRGITFTAIKVNNLSDQMIKVMQEYYDRVGDLKLIVSDLSQAT